jgi:hypothetical protein
VFYKRKAWRDGQGIFRLNLDTSIVSLPRARIKGRWLTRLTPLSGETLPLRDKRRLRDGGANDCVFISALQTLAMRGASEIAVAGAPDLLHIWLEQLRKEGLPFQSSGQSNEVLSEAEYSESIHKGFIDGLCEASAIFCNRREAQEVQAEFEEKQAATKPPVLADIRERFLRDAAILRIESREGVCDRLTHNSDPNGALNHPYKVANAGFTEWMENLGKFAAGHVMSLARMAHAHSEWGVADPAEWARIQVAEFVNDELYPKRCRKCGKSRGEHSGPITSSAKPSHELNFGGEWYPAKKRILIFTSMAGLSVGQPQFGFERIRIDRGFLTRSALQL